MARILISTPVLDGCLDPLRGHELIEGAPGSDPAAQALICDPTQPVGADVQARMPGLRVIGVAGAGCDAVDEDAARARAIPVLTAGEGLVESTADLAFGLIIAASRLMHDAEQSLRAGSWEGWRFVEERFGRDVHGATLGLLGFGSIGRAVARRAGGFGMDVLHHTRHPTGLPGWVADLDEMLGLCDVLSVHVPLTASTRGLIDARRIALLRESAVIVNTARGAVVEEQALAEALEQGRLFAAGLDVYEGEPAVAQRLLAAPRTVMLPHIGSATLRTRRAMLRGIAGKVAHVLEAAEG
jgi:lactate dehydrogenase-like 2-hydroxyacid dehydrogenase